MQNLIIKEKKSVYLVPEINFDAQSGQCWIKGEAYLENTTEFFGKLNNWIKDYTTKIGKAIIFNLQLIYFNTSSQRALLELFWILKDYHRKGGNVILNWHYPEGDVDQLMEAEDYAKDIELDFNLIAYKSE